MRTSRITTDARALLAGQQSVPAAKPNARIEDATFPVGPELPVPTQAKLLALIVRDREARPRDAAIGKLAVFGGLGHAINVAGCAPVSGSPKEREQAWRDWSVSVVPTREGPIYPDRSSYRNILFGRDFDSPAP